MKKHTVKNGDIVKQEDRTIVVLRVSKRDLKKGLNAERAGLYGFYGIWYGEDIGRHQSYGKIEYKKLKIILIFNVLDCLCLPGFFLGQHSKNPYPQPEVGKTV